MIFHEIPFNMRARDLKLDQHVFSSKQRDSLQSAGGVVPTFYARRCGLDGAALRCAALCRQRCSPMAAAEGCMGWTRY